MKLTSYVVGLVLLVATGCAGTTGGMRTLAGESGRGVEREIAKVDAALGALGPAHPLRARRAAIRLG